MAYKIIFTAEYEKRVSKFLKKHSDIKNLYIKTIQLLELNPQHPSLRLHKLNGKHEGLHSVSINMQYRITLEFLMKEETIIPVNIGGHEVY
jgi:mRNA-degrading endonuclease YafQ of YafQ-DinJ toxin-antitoxin module